MFPVDFEETEHGPRLKESGHSEIHFIYEFFFRLVVILRSKHFHQGHVKLLVDELSHDDWEERQLDEAVIGVQLERIQEVVVLIVVVDFDVAQEVLVNVHHVVPILTNYPFVLLHPDILRKLLRDHQDLGLVLLGLGLVAEA